MQRFPHLTVIPSLDEILGCLRHALRKRRDPVAVTIAVCRAADLLGQREGVPVDGDELAGREDLPHPMWTERDFDRQAKA